MRFSATVFWGLVYLGYGIAAAGEIAWQTDIDAAWAQAQRESRPLLVFAVRPNCKYCTLMKQRTYAENLVTQRVNDDFVPLFVQSQHEPEFMEELSIKAYPTTVIIAPDTTIVGSLKGYIQTPQFVQQLDAAEQRARAAEQPRSARRQPNGNTR